jgi:hypothetical protein
MMTAKTFITTITAITGMADRLRLHRARIMLLACLSCLLLGGCAGPTASFNSENRAPPFRDANLSMQSAKEIIVIGQSIRAEVLAALGPATVVKFDSGFEVWVYRTKSSESKVEPAEFVVLFAPSGIVKKTRLRPAYDRSTTGR